MPRGGFPDPLCCLTEMPTSVFLVFASLFVSPSVAEVVMSLADALRRGTEAQEEWPSECDGERNCPLLGSLCHLPFPVSFPRQARPRWRLPATTIILKLLYCSPRLPR